MNEQEKKELDKLEADVRNAWEGVCKYQMSDQDYDKIVKKRDDYKNKMKEKYNS